VSQVFEGLCDDLARWLSDPPSAPPDWPADTWDAFRQAAQVHGAAPLLWLRVRSLPAWSDSPIGRWLEDQYAWNALRIARLHGELAEILRLFAAQEVPILPIKGAVLGSLIYEDPAARPMADLDVLLRAEHFPAGEALLGRLGYAKVFTGWKHTRFARPGNLEIVDRDHEHPDNPRQLEVHPRCQERIRGDLVDLTDLLWSTASRGELLGVPAWLPDSGASWLQLLVHATHHVLLNTFRLVQLADLARLGPRVRDPEPLLATVDARAAYPALALLERYFPTPRDAALRACLRSRVPQGFAAWADGLDLFAVCHLNPVPWRAVG
jgi:hypothetical protein